MYALARNDKTAGGVEPRPYAAFVVTSAVIVRADRVVRPYKMFDEPDAASPRRTFFPPDGKKRDALRPAPHKKTHAVKGKFCTDIFVALTCHASACLRHRALIPHKICPFPVRSSFANEYLR